MTVSTFVTAHLLVSCDDTTRLLYFRTTCDSAMRLQGGCVCRGVSGSAGHHIIVRSAQPISPLQRSQSLIDEYDATLSDSGGSLVGYDGSDGGSFDFLTGRCRC